MRQCQNLCEPDEHSLELKHYGIPVRLYDCRRDTPARQSISRPPPAEATISTQQQNNCKLVFV